VERAGNSAINETAAVLIFLINFSMPVLPMLKICLALKGADSNITDNFQT
jgi:hypothetical protein